MNPLFKRRQILAGLGAGLTLTGCEKLGSSDAGQSLLSSTQGFTDSAMRLVTGRTAMAREFSEGDMSPRFRANGSRSGSGPEYSRHLSEGFANWRLTVGGLVERPASYSLTELMNMPRRVQITRHDCVEGWSAIGKWHGVPLKLLLDASGVRDSARYVLFRCADELSGAPYYETVHMIEAVHPQTILAYGMNGQRLPEEHGAPLRLRSERQLGYKQAKYVMAVEVIDDFAGLYGGNGGFWEDRGYDWWAGI